MELAGQQHIVYSEGALIIAEFINITIWPFLSLNASTVIIENKKKDFFFFH